MGAPAIYHVPNRRRSGCALSTASVSPVVNGVHDKRLGNGCNYEHYLKGPVDDNPVNGSSLSSSLFGRSFGTHNLPRTKSFKWNPFARKSRGLLGVIKAQSKKNRVVSKHGRINVYRVNEDNENKHRYLKDFFTSMIDLTWAKTLLLFCTSFYISWLLFSVVWYLLALSHGDLLPSSSLPSDHVACVENIKDFTSCFLFSLETQHTIGYGVRVTTEECPVAIVVMSCQCIVGVIIQACLAGIVFAKFTKPTNRAETILFSTNALITLRNGSYYLLCRIGDLRPTHLLESHVSGQMVKKEVTDEGEEIPYYLESMDFGTEIDGSNDFFQMFWPIVLAHKIDSESPLYNMSARNIAQNTFEIVLTMEGITPETGNTVQVRTSYLPNEILWGYRFEHTCVTYDQKMAKYVVSISNMNKIIPDNTPRCSPQAWDEKLARESVNPRLSISLAGEILGTDENGKKEPIIEDKNMNDQLLSVSLLGKSD